MGGRPGCLLHINSPMPTTEKSVDRAETCKTAMARDQRSVVLVLGVSLAVVALLVAAFLFEYDYGTKYCNSQVCLDEVAIGSVSMGLISVGNPISIGVVSFSSFLAVGIIPVAPISIGLLPIGLAYLGYDYLNFVKGRYIFID